jgi:predicted ATPase
LDLGHYGEPGANPVGDHYKDNLDFVKKTVDTVIRDTVDGQKAKISLAMAIDMLEPCNWDFVGSVVTILKAIGGNLHPVRPYACHQRNIELSPLRDRLRIISNTLRAFWKNDEKAADIDEDVLASFGQLTPVKRWLAASLDKTIRLQLEASSEFWLTFS